MSENIGRLSTALADRYGIGRQMSLGCRRLVRL